MSNPDTPASDMVIGMGEMVDKMVNLKGEPVGKRNGDSETSVGAHYGNTGKSCVYSLYGMCVQCLVTNVQSLLFTFYRCGRQICHVEEAFGIRLVPPVSLQCPFGAEASVGRWNWARR